MSTGKITIHQFHYSVSRADAVTNQMLFIREALREVGIDGEIFAVEKKELPHGKVRAFSPELIAGCDVLLLHHSHGNPALARLLQVDVPKALIYHNITPAEFFRHDPYIARLCRLGRRQLMTLRRSVVANFAASNYNAWELEALGFRKSPIFPLFDLDSPEMKKRPVPPVDSDHRTLLFVGRIAPHKNQALLIQTCYYLNQLSKTRWDLVLVGGKDLVYAEYLRLLARALGMERHVKLVGRVTDDELEGYYRRADAFVSTSLHEGFCIPLIEAMRAGVPVFALPMAGARETLGAAGVQLATRKPHRIAAVIAAALQNPACASAALKSQKRRLAQVQALQNRHRVQTLCRNLVTGLKASASKPETLPAEKASP